MSSVKSVFEETVRSTVDNFCATFSYQMSEWLKENKEVDVTPEELCSAFNITYRQPSTPGVPTGASIQTTLPNIPNYFTGGVSPAKKKGGRAKKEANPNLARCEYVMTRGKSSGNQCENQVQGDSTLGADRFCKGCLKKAAVKAQLEGAPAKSMVQPPSLPNSSVKVTEESASGSNELQVVAINEDTYRETNHGFIITRKSDGSLVTDKVEDNGVFRDLKENEKKIALDLGLQVLHQDSVVKLPAIPSVPSVPQISTFSLPVPMPR
jgi:hypothetical protein